MSVMFIALGGCDKTSKNSRSVQDLDEGLSQDGNRMLESEGRGRNFKCSRIKTRAIIRPNRVNLRALNQTKLRTDKVSKEKLLSHISLTKAFGSFTVVCIEMYLYMYIFLAAQHLYDRTLSLTSI